MSDEEKKLEDELQGDIHPEESSPPPDVNNIDTQAYQSKTASVSREAQDPQPHVAHVEVSVALAKGMRVRVTVEALPSLDGAPALEVVPVQPEQEYAPQTLKQRGAVTSFEVPAVPRTYPQDRVSPRTVRDRFTGVFDHLRRAWAVVQRATRAEKLPVTLFALSLLVYLSTRLIGLDDFPIYFFTDEAVQTVMAADFLDNDFRNYDKEFLPTYFNRDATYNLSSITVYLQVIPYILFGKSVFVTRGVSVLVATLGALAFGLILRDVFKIRYWWSGVLLLSIAPAWFLHSRTAFEVVEMVSFYTGFLYFYMLYRSREPRYLYAALILGAMTFYTYSPGQLIIVLTGLLLLISDFRYHWEQRAVALRGLVLLGILVLPYLRFYLAHPDAPLQHLTTRAPFWMQPVPFSEKLSRFWSEYLYGLSPGYWFVPNKQDLDRHLMKDYGHLLRVTFPFYVIGLSMALMRFRSSAHRAVLIAMLVAPTGSALVRIGITRTLVFVIPAVLLITLGLDRFLAWVERPAELFKLFRREKVPGWLERWKPSEGGISIGLMAILVVANFAMLRDALVNGPTWYQDYTLGGMQYGARQLFGAVEEYLSDHPGVEMMVSPSWTNGADAVKQFFLPGDLPVRLGSIEGYLFQHLPINEKTVFVMISSELDKVYSSEKFTDIQIEKILNYPNGKPGFYFVRLRYVEDIEAILEAEREQRRQLLEAEVTIDDQQVRARYSMLDIGEIWVVFDGDPTTVARTLEANPFVIELTFPEPRALSGFSMIIGSLDGHVTAQLYESPEAEPLVYDLDFEGSVAEPRISLDFDREVSTQVLRFEVLDPHSAEPAHIHVWEIYLR